MGKFLAQSNSRTLERGDRIPVGRNQFLRTFAYVSDDGKMIATQEPGEVSKLNHVENCIGVTIVDNPDYWRNRFTADELATLDAVGEVSITVRNWLIDEAKRRPLADAFRKLITIGDAVRSKIE